MKEEITAREYVDLKESMKQLHDEMKVGFTEMGKEIKSVNSEITALKLTQEAHKNSFVTYKQILIVGAWFIGTGLTILLAVISYLKLVNHTP